MMWSAAPLSSCPQCHYQIAPELQRQAHFCPVCRFPLSVLAGKYQLQALLGEGGSGKVYLAHHIGLSEAHERVIKILSDHNMNHAHIERFYREVQITARVSLTNDHIVRIYDDFGHEPNLGYYYVMEYLQGRSLGQILREEGALPAPKALSWFGQLCEAIHAAHQAGIIHRDLKPENILLISRIQGDESIKVIDFGIAKPTARSHEISEHVVGTPLYMSPEQCLGQALDARSDIYAMGLILYEMLTGQHPFAMQISSSEDDMLTIIYSQIHENIHPIKHSRPELNIPPELDDVIQIATQKNPNHRYPSVELFWQSIQQAALASFLWTPSHPGFSIPSISLADKPTELSLPPFSITTQASAFFNTAITQALPTPAPVLPSAESWSGVMPQITGNLSALHLPANRFVGRASSWQQLDASWSQGSRLVTVLGCAGIGKTRLAQEYGYQQRIQQNWPGGIWYCDLSAVASIGEFLETLLQILQIQLPVESTLHGALRSMGTVIQSHGPSLWILDHFDPMVRFTHDTLAHWLELAPEARFLITSRQRLGLSEEQLVELPPLDSAEAIELFLDRAVAFTTDHLSTEDPVLLAIIQALEGLPLALEITAAQLYGMTLATLHDQLFHSFQMGGESFRQNHDFFRVWFTLDSSWHTLSAEEQEIFAQCSVFHGGFSLQAAEAVLQCQSWAESSSISHILSALRDRSLLRLSTASTAASVSQQAPRFQMYPMTRQYAGEKLEQTGQLFATQQRHAQFYLMWAQQQIVSNETPEPHEHHESLQLEKENLRVIIERYYTSSPEFALQAQLVLYPVLVTQEGTQHYLEQLHDILSVGGVISSSLRMEALQIQAECLRKLGQIQKAQQILENALAMAYARDHSTNKAKILNRLANLLRTQGHLLQAETMHREALTLYRQQDHWHGIGISLGLLGNLYRLQGKINEAEDCLREALQLHRQHKDRRSEAVSLSQLGNLYRNQGKLDDALHTYEHALTLQQQQGNTRGECITLCNMGMIKQKQGFLLEAEQCYQQALVLYRDIEDRRGESIVLDQMGMGLQLRGLYSEAMTLHTQALNLYQQLYDRRGEGYCLHNLARIFRIQGHWQTAQEYLEHAIQIHQTIPDHGGVGMALYHLGLLWMEQSMYDHAQSYLEQSLDHLRASYMQEQEGDVLLALALLHHEQQDLATALTHVQVALQLAIQRGDVALETRSTSCLIAVAADMEKFEKAYGAHTQAKKLCEQQNNPTFFVGWDLDSAHLDLALAQHAQFQQQDQVAQKYHEAALQKYQKAFQQLQHAFWPSPSPLSRTTERPIIPASDHLRLSLRRLHRALFPV